MFYVFFRNLFIIFNRVNYLWYQILYLGVFFLRLSRKKIRLFIFRRYQRILGLYKLIKGYRSFRVCKIPKTIYETLDVFIYKRQCQTVYLFTDTLLIINGPIVLFEFFLFGRFYLNFFGWQHHQIFYFQKFALYGFYFTKLFTFLRNFVNVFQNRVSIYRFFWLVFSLRAFFFGEYRFRCSIPTLSYTHTWYKTGYTQIFYGNYVGTRIRRLLKNLFNRFDDGNNIPTNNIPTFGFGFQFIRPFGDGK